MMFQLITVGIVYVFIGYNITVFVVVVRERIHELFIVVVKVN